MNAEKFFTSQKHNLDSIRFIFNGIISEALQAMKGSV